SAFSSGHRHKEADLLSSAFQILQNVHRVSWGNATSESGCHRIQGPLAGQIPLDQMSALLSQLRFIGTTEAQCHFLMGRVS
ncbi:MAG: hypothetical protein QNL80_14050, partial [Akkermansiaceae bacterium]